MNAEDNSKKSLECLFGFHKLCWTYYEEYSNNASNFLERGWKVQIICKRCKQIIDTLLWTYEFKEDTIKYCREKNRFINEHSTS